MNLSTATCGTKSSKIIILLHVHKGGKLKGSTGAFLMKFGDGGWHGVAGSGGHPLARSAVGWGFVPCVRLGVCFPYWETWGKRGNIFVNPFAFILVLEQNYLCCGTRSSKTHPNLGCYRNKRGTVPTCVQIVRVRSVTPSLLPCTSRS